MTAGTPSALSPTVKAAIAQALEAADQTGEGRLAALARHEPSTLWRLVQDGVIDLPSLSRHTRTLVADACLGVAAASDGGAIDRLVTSLRHEAPVTALATLVDRLTVGERSPVLLEALFAQAEHPHHRQTPALRSAAQHSIESGDAARAHALLSALGGADTTLATAQWISRQRKRLADDPLQPIARVALLGSFTLDHVLPYLDLELRRLGFVPDVYNAPFDTWAREVIDPGAALRRHDPDLAILAVALDDLLPDLADRSLASTLAAAADLAVQRVADAAREYVAWSGKPILVHAFHSVFIGRGDVEGRDGPAGSAWLAALNARLAEALHAIPRTYLLDVTAVLTRSGAGMDAGKLRHLAALRLPPAAMPELARTYARHLAPIKGLTRKCVVLDLDNTLWGGVIGEDGMHGIRLGHTSPGAEFVEFQRFLASLPARGILLAVCSKNNPDDALEAIRTHKSMVLQEAMFSAVRINWQPKPENLASIAKELNIGVDSLIFVDDNPDERELMRQLLPHVLTVEMPTDPARYRETLETLPQLQVLDVTEEDRARVEQYRTNRQRDVERDTTVSLDSYLQSLDVRIGLAPIDDASIGRVAQLFQRTNQFNVTTRRHEQADLQRMRGAADWRQWTLRAGDKFGEHGLVAVGLVRIADGRWIIDSFLMSCRVIGYGIETALLAAISAEAIAAGAMRLEGEFIATKKNAPALDLYRRHGFVQSDDGTTDGVERWTLDLPNGGIAHPTWITQE